MSWSNVILILALLIMIVLFLNNLKKDNKPKVDDPIINTEPNPYEHCDILLTPNGLYVPTYKTRYVYITTGGIAETWIVLNKWNSFKSKEEAKDYLDKWLALRGVGLKSVGIS